MSIIQQPQFALNSNREWASVNPFPVLNIQDYEQRRVTQQPTESINLDFNTNISPMNSSTKKKKRRRCCCRRCKRSYREDYTDDDPWLYCFNCDNDYCICGNGYCKCGDYCCCCSEGYCNCDDGCCNCDDGCCSCDNGYCSCDDGFCDCDDDW